jgi:cold-inducible RNA-binding protein
LTKLYVGNLPYSVNDQQLAEIFAEFGPVASASVIMDRMSGRSKGFGFVEIENDETAKQAIEKLNNTEVDGRKLLVSVARPMEERPRRNDGGFNRGRRF